MRVALATASLFLVAVGATACSDSGDGEAETATTTTADFCQAFEDFTTALADIDPSDPEAAIRKLKDEAGKLENAGTPEDIPEEASQGFDVVLAAIEDIPDDASPEDVADLEGSLSADEEKQSEAFEAYLEDACPDLS